jgi:hypothetical protein
VVGEDYKEEDLIDNLQVTKEILDLDPENFEVDEEWKKNVKLKEGVVDSGILAEGFSSTG